MSWVLATYNIKGGVRTHPRRCRRRAHGPYRTVIADFAPRSRAALAY
jgi:hypothetical protein